MQSGRLRHRIEIQRNDATTGDNGELIDDWQTQAIVAASVEPLQGRELFAADQIKSEISVRVRLRYLDGIHAGMRVLFRGDYYDILAVINPKMRNEVLQLMCGSGMNDG